MLPYLAAMVVGGILVQRKRPAVAHKKKTAIGPRSGVTYEVDDFTTAGLIIVKSPDGTIVAFARKASMGTTPDKGFDFVRGHGNAQVIELIKKDFMP